MNLEGVVEFDESDLIYNEHFPDYPTVPGCLAINFFLTLLDQKLVGEKFKFIRFMKPGVEYSYSVKQSGNKISCKLFISDTTYISGVLKCK